MFGRTFLGELTFPWAIVTHRQALGLAAHLPPRPSPGWALLGVAGGSLLLTQRWQGERGWGGRALLADAGAGWL